MSLAKRIKIVDQNATNQTCRTCRFLASMPEDDRVAFWDWVDAGNSKAQLWELCRTETPPLQVSVSQFRHHIRHHRPVS